MSNKLVLPQTEVAIGLEATRGTKVAATDKYVFRAFNLDGEKTSQQLAETLGDPSALTDFPTSVGAVGTLKAYARYNVVGRLFHMWFGERTRTAILSAVAGGADTTLSAGASAGDKTITVADATGIASGDVLHIAGATSAADEHVTVDGAPAGTTVTIKGYGTGGGLLYAHANAAVVKESVEVWKHEVTNPGITPPPFTAEWDLKLGSDATHTAKIAYGCQLSSLGLMIPGGGMPMEIDAGISGSHISINQVPTSALVLPVDTGYYKASAELSLLIANAERATFATSALNIAYNFGTGAAQPVLADGVRKGTVEHAGPYSVSLSGTLFLPSSDVLQDIRTAWGGDDLGETTVKLDNCSLTIPGANFGAGTPQQKNEIKLEFAKAVLVPTLTVPESGKATIGFTLTSQYDSVAGYACKTTWYSQGYTD